MRHLQTMHGQSAVGGEALLWQLNAAERRPRRQAMAQAPPAYHAWAFSNQQSAHGCQREGFMRVQEAMHLGEEERRIYISLTNQELDGRPWHKRYLDSMHMHGHLANSNHRMDAAERGARLCRRRCTWARRSAGSTSASPIRSAWQRRRMPAPPR